MKANSDATALNLLQDNQFQYSTHSPPLAAETSAVPAPDTTPLGLSDGPPHPRHSPVQAPAPPLTAVGEAHQAQLDLGDDLDEPRGVRPELIGAEPAHNPRSGAALPPALRNFSLQRRARRPHLRVPPPILGSIALAVLLLLGATLVRRQGYNSDLQAADSLAGQGHYSTAIGKYGQASGEWPFHDAAIAGQATAVAQASATATMRAGQVALYAARQQSRMQDSQQYDLAIVATATSLASDQQAQATATVQARQATATADAAATEATATAVAATAHAAATAVAERSGIYAARRHRRQLAGQRADADAAQVIASATAVANRAIASATAVANQGIASATAIAATRQAIANAYATAAAAHRAQHTPPSGPAAAAPTAIPPTAAPSRAGVATAPATSVPSERPVIYAAIGASEAVGVGADDPPTQSWVADLSRRLPIGSRLVNMGKAGALLDYGLQSELPAVVASNPDVVTVWMVVNDINAQISPAIYQGELNAVLATLQHKTHARVFVGNVPDLTKLPVYKRLDPAQVTRTAQTFSAIIAQIAHAHGATLVDLYGPTTQTLPTHPEYISGDGFHPSTAGYANLATIWWASIRPQLPQ